MAPLGNFSRHFVSLTKDGLIPILKKHYREVIGGATAQFDRASFVQLLAVVFNSRSLRWMQTEKRGFGKSFQTNGVEVIFRMAPNGYNEDKDEKNKKGQEKRERNRELVAAGEEPEEPWERAEKLARRSATAPKQTFTQLFRVTSWLRGGYMEVVRTKESLFASLSSLCRSTSPPPTAAKVGVDPGYCNPVSWCSEHGKDGNFGTVSRGQFNHNTGKSMRDWRAAKRLKWALANNIGRLRTATDAIEAVSCKTGSFAELRGALAVRANNHTALYAFYGREQLAVDRFLNYSGEQREAEAIAKRIAPTLNIVVAWGDANFIGINIALMVKKALIRRLGRKQVIDTPENMTSQLSRRIMKG
jgi:hypothetical protein